MARGELHLWWTEEGENIFVYYLTGAMGLSFLVTIAIIRSLRRKESRVIELLPDDNLREMLVTYLLSVTTAITPGSNCPDNVKVFMQLCGENKYSQFFALKSHTGGRPMFQRGLVDIFLFKVPVSLGRITAVKLVLSGVDSSFAWKISRVQLYDPSTAEVCGLPATVLATEIMRFGDATEKIISLEKPWALWFLYICIYHQWLAGFVNSVWFGAFTEIVHVVSIFVTLFNMFTFTLIAFITLPGGSLEDAFDLNTSSMLIGSFAASFLGSLLCFGLEVLIRSVRSVEKVPGSAYHTIIKENNCATNMGRIDASVVENNQQPTIWTAFVMQSDEFGHSSKTSMTSLKSMRGKTLQMPNYLGKLLAFIELKEDKLRELEKQRLELLEKGISMLTLKKSVHASQVSFLTCAQSYSEALEVDIPRFSEICLNVMLSGKTSLSVMMDDEDDSDVKGSQTKSSYFDILKSRFDHENGMDDEIGDENEELTINVGERDMFSLAQTDSVETTAKRSKTRNKDTRRKYSSHSNDFANIEMKVGEKQKTLENAKLDADDFKSVAETTKEKTGLDTAVDTDVTATGKKTKEHVVDIDDIEIKEADEKHHVQEVKIDIADVDSGDIEDQTTLRRRPLSSTKASLEAVTDDVSAKVKKTGEIVDAGQSINSTEKLQGVGITSRKKTSVTHLMWLEWQKAQKEWCRKVVQSVHKSFMACRTDLMNGMLVTSGIDIILLEWSHEVIKRIAASCSMRRRTFEKEILESQHLIKLFTHLSSEIIMLVITDVYRCLKCSECVALADLIIQSHHVMMAVEHAADCVTYILNKDREEIQEPFKYLDMGQDLLDIRDSFLQMCFDLVVTHNDVTWTYFLALLKDEKQQRHMLQLSLDRLLEFVEVQHEHENAEDTTVNKLCLSVETEAKLEVWKEYNSQEKMFTSLLVKQQILNQLAVKIKDVMKMKKKFDIRYDLLPVPPKSRLEKLVEKRRKKVVQFVDEKEDGEKTAENDIDRAELEIVSKALGRYEEVLVYMRDTVKRKWTRQGLKMSVPLGKYLAQALLHPLVQTDEHKIGKYKFSNFLHLKRTESFLQTYLESVVLEMAEVLLSDIVLEFKLKTAELTETQQRFVVDDLLVKVNLMTVILTQDIRSLTRQVIGIEASTTSINMAMVKRSSQLLLWQSSLVLNRNFSAIPADENSNDTPKQSHKIQETTDAVDEKSDGHAGSEKQTAASDEGETVGDAPDDSSDEISVQNLIDDLKPLKEYLEYVQHAESLRSQCTQIGYLERQKEKREFIHSVSINNIIDSYYMIKEGDDSHTFTKAGLYQLEHDFVGESSRPLPRWLKTFLVCLMVLMILFSMLYVCLIGGQFTTTQIQEWVCYCILSLALFGFVFEPIRAVVLGYLMEKP